MYIKQTCSNFQNPQTLIEFKKVSSSTASDRSFVHSEQKRQKKYKTREEIKQDEEDLLRKIIEEKMDIRGGYSKPVYTDVLWFQILLLPYFVYKYVVCFFLFIVNKVT